MSAKVVGTVLEKKIKVEVIEAEPGKVGFGWRISDEVRRELEELEDNVRKAERESVSLIVG